jgi:hypothetical protein
MLISKGQVKDALHRLRQVAVDLKRANPAAYVDEAAAFADACRRNPEWHALLKTGRALYPGEFETEGAGV